MTVTSNAPASVATTALVGCQFTNPRAPLEIHASLPHEASSLSRSQEALTPPQTHQPEASKAGFVSPGLNSMLTSLLGHALLSPATPAAMHLPALEHAKILTLPTEKAGTHSADEIRGHVSPADETICSSAGQDTNKLQHLVHFPPVFPTPTSLRVADHANGRRTDCHAASPMPNSTLAVNLYAASSTSSLAIEYPKPLSRTLKLNRSEVSLLTPSSSSKSPRLFGRRRIESSSPLVASPEPLEHHHRSATSAVESLAAQSLNVLMLGSTNAFLPYGRFSLSNGDSAALSKPTAEPNGTGMKIGGTGAAGLKERGLRSTFVVKDRHTQMAEWAQRSWVGVTSKTPTSDGDL